ncbi:MAG: GNAT family N-acetyltransferase [Ndongobacter sp.]|nr:GNAT family N-acetyltransferase [Ndongobacter sp.]
MKHAGTEKIKTDRLLLRKFKKRDAPAMYRNWASDEMVTRFLMWPPHSSPRETRKIVRGWAGHYDHRDWYQWAIVLREGEILVGSIGVNRFLERTRTAQIGYCIGRQWWHRGITSEALSAVIAYLFERTPVQRIAAWHDPRNPHSGAVMRKCGMTYEGLLRKADWNNQGICDACHYSILRDEYEERRERETEVGRGCC